MVFKGDFKRADERGVNLFNHPKLKEANAIKILTDTFDDRLKKFYLYGSIRGETLFLFFNHQIGVLEFNSKKEMYLEKMREVYKREKLKEVIMFKRVNAQLKLESVKIANNKKRVEPDIAKGEFEIKCKDAKLKKMFEDIQKAIKRNNMEAENDTKTEKF